MLVKNKLIIIGFLTLLVILMLSFPIVNKYHCYEITEQEYTQQLDNTINTFDYSILDKILSTLNLESKKIFGTDNFYEKIKSLLDGEFKENSNSFINACLNIIFEDVLNFLPILCFIVAIAIIASFIGQLQTSIGSKSLYNIVHFVCYGLIITITSTMLFEVVTITNDTLVSIKEQMEIVFPILLTLVASIGGSVSVGVFQPSIVLLSSCIMELFNNIVLPIFIITIIFIIAQNISNNIKFSKFTNFFQSGFKWIIGFTFTVFFAFLSINGIMANTYDSLSIRTAKFTLKSYIPFVGGYLSDGFDLILSSSVLVKNAIGVTGLFLLFATIIYPIIKIVILSLGLKLTSAILEPISDSRIPSYIFSISKALNMLVACLLSVSFMYVLVVGLLMCACNIF